MMWFPTRHDAVEMFARFLRAHHGTAASRLARKNAEALRNEGDLDGCKIWTEIADALEGQALPTLAPSTANILELT
jgi:hypothetical protein